MMPHGKRGPTPPDPLSGQRRPGHLPGTPDVADPPSPTPEGALTIPIFRQRIRLILSLGVVFLLVMHLLVLYSIFVLNRAYLYGTIDRFHVQGNRRDPDRRRWEALPVEERRDSVARAHAYVAEHQEATEARATQRHARWSEAEDAVLIARADVPAPVLAAELGQTLHGVYRRRDRLRARGLLPER